MTDPKILALKPVAQVQIMGSFQGVPHYGCLLTMAAERRMKVNDPLYGTAELETYAAALAEAARQEERETQAAVRRKLLLVLHAAVALVRAPSWAGISDEDCELERVLIECGYLERAG